jgi:Concanavalin A-like lectin/glucanases superfamily/Secretion system C-terminal sorting domain/Fibronectin type III domain
MKNIFTFSWVKKSLFFYPSLFCIITATAQPGNSLNYDGVDDYVIAGPAGGIYTAGSSYTKEAWINYGGPNFVNVENIVSSSDPFWVESGHLSAANNFSGGPIDLQDAATLVPGKWTYVAVTYDAGTTTLKMYKNGVLIGTNTTVAASASGQVYIGAYNDGSVGYTWKGGMDQVRIYNTALTQAQIQADMVSTTASVPASLRASYNFDIGTAGGTNTGLTTLPDGTANAFDGTLINFTLLPGPISNWEESYALLIPTADAASNVNGNYFVANWTPPTAAGTIDNYVVDISTTADFSSPVSGSPITVPFGTNFTYVYGLSINTTYYYRVAADKTSVTGQGALSNTITVTTLGVLPVNQLVLSVSRSSGGNLLQWSTAAEVNTNYFELQRSDNNRDYTTITRINAAGNSNSLKEYQYTDNVMAVKPVLYYRLKLTDADGKISISNIVLIKNTDGGAVTVYPNPVVNRFVLNVTNKSLINSNAVLSDMNGHVMQIIPIRQTATEVDMTKFAHGVYLLKLSSGETVKITK